MPSKELLDRSPAPAACRWDELTYGSWSPELLPTLVVREAYGTRARDTDWMDGFYPYHEMNTYMGLIAMVLAVVGAGGGRRATAGRASGSCWSASACVLMLGRFTFLFDYAPSSCRSWAARASRCGSICGFRWGWPRWRPSASSGSGGPASCRSAAG